MTVQGSDYGSALPTSKGNTPNTLTPADSATHTPGMSSSASRNSSMDDPRAPATTPDPAARPVSFDFGQGPPRGPRQSMDVGSDLGPGSQLNSPIQSRAASMDYGPNAPPPSLAGRQHPSGEGSAVCLCALCASQPPTYSWQHLALYLWRYLPTHADMQRTMISAMSCTEILSCLHRSGKTL